jgi:hypothetical protein
MWSEAEEDIKVQSKSEEGTVQKEAEEVQFRTERGRGDSTVKKRQRGAVQ